MSPHMDHVYRVIKIVGTGDAEYLPYFFFNSRLKNLIVALPHDF